MEWLKNAIKSYDTLITEALDANDETKLKEYCSKAPKPKIAIVMCTLLEDYGSYRRYVNRGQKNKIYNGSDEVKDVQMEKEKKLAQISLLLKYGSDFLNHAVQVKYSGISTPLVCAVITMDADMVKLLIEKGADVKLLFPADEPINSALHEACKCDKYLVELDAEKEQQLKIINILLDNGADVNSKITFEKKHMSGNITLGYRTPLMVALCDKLDDHDVKIFKTLLERKEYNLSVKGEWSHETLKEIVKGKKQSSHRDAILKLIADVEARPKADGRRSRGKKRIGTKDGRSGKKRSGTKKDGRSRKKKVGRSQK